MKVIDLLNRIANGEEVPKKIKKRWVYEWSYDELRDDFCYITKEGKRFDDDWLIIDILEDEIEIIEDEKIKKIFYCCMKSENDEINILVDNNNTVVDKLNEIIDKINELEDKDEKIIK